MAKSAPALKGFELAAPVEAGVRCLILALWGHEKTGKSHFAMTAPSPIAYFHMDIGGRRVVNKFCKKKRILVSDHRFLPPEQGVVVKAPYLAEWNRFVHQLGIARDDPKIRTVILDTHTAVYELCRLARFGKLTEVKPFHYGPVNAELTELVNSFAGIGKNLILIGKSKKEYKDDVWTGNYEQSGIKDIGFLADVSMETGFNKEKGEDDNTFFVKVTRCGDNMALCGMEFRGADYCNFPCLASNVFCDEDGDPVSEEEWL